MPLPTGPQQYCDPASLVISLSVLFSPLRLVTYLFNDPNGAHIYGHVFPFNPQEGHREAVNLFFSWELLRPLLNGATLYVIADNVIYDPNLLTKFIGDHGINR